MTLDNREARKLAYEILQLVDQRVDRELSGSTERVAFLEKELANARGPDPWATLE